MGRYTTKPGRRLKNSKHPERGHYFGGRCRAKQMSKLERRAMRARGKYTACGVGKDRSETWTRMLEGLARARRQDAVEARKAAA